MNLVCPEGLAARREIDKVWGTEGTELILMWLDLIMVNASGEIVATEHLAGQE